MMSKNVYLEKLKRDLERRRYSETTIQRYLYIVSKFLDYKKDKEISNLTEEDAIDYLDYLTIERKYKAPSYNNVNSILKFFLEVTLEKNISYRSMPSAKLERKIKIVPSKETILNIINYTKNLKHKLWYSLAYGSGLRLCEITNLTLSNFDTENMKIKVIGKGDKERITLLSKLSLELLNEYIRQNNITDKNEYLFKGQKKGHIHRETISRSFKTIVDEMKLKEHITLHSLRRSFATHLLRMGESMEVVKELMGHESITTTSGYVQYVYPELKIKNPLDSEPYGTRN